MELKEKIEAEGGALKYSGVPCIMISKPTQGQLTREMHNLAGKGKKLFGSARNFHDIFFDYPTVSMDELPSKWLERIG
ncbi:MAG: hypothetical protein HXS54_08855 [Theionarchaea archaeon]|nr:hypothetical protein [Theionarchaea archaeon]